MTLYAYNGWLASKNPADFGGLESLVIAGESFAPGVRAGDVHDVFEYVATQIHLRVEPVVKPEWHQADDWGYSFKNSANSKALISCHSAGCAFDYNATRHPNNKRGTWTPAQVAEIRKILAEVDGVVYWGGDAWGDGTPDEMHFEIKDGVTEAQVAAVARKIASSVTRVTPAPAASHPTVGRPTVRRGSTGAPVIALQTVLAKKYPAYRHKLGVLVIDGDFGPTTEKWVKEFQKRSGLVVDGVVGPKTWATLGG